MAISFPRVIPDALKLVGLDFNIEPMDAQTPLRSGKVISKDLGPALWRASFTTPPRTEDQWRELQAWYMTLRSLESFYAYHNLRQYPKAYPDGFDGLEVGGNPFDGFASLEGATGGVVLSLGSLPETFAFAVGDFLSFSYGTSQALHMIVAGGVADASGEVDVEVRPHIQPGWTADTPVRLHRAYAEMKIVPGSFSGPTDVKSLTSVSFEAIQTLD
ncbi:hypothetical protein A7A08_01712 [Methyloligella halotolerans]|uniref:Uncharacterized protein n=1 Tax=Methyloligella halotolerans TaxID=1177755 RepID=A0A1E2RZK9_9HYPH|nr:hypothetical protein [Methyloligella halotolerans]ODA67677.1 hypothetical protein A7A08_01712 [Methyloligella halotolerans]